MSANSQSNHLTRYQKTLKGGVIWVYLSFQLPHQKIYKKAQRFHVFTVLQRVYKIWRFILEFGFILIPPFCEQIKSKFFLPSSNELFRLELESDIGVNDCTSFLLFK